MVRAPRIQVILVGLVALACDVEPRPTGMPAVCAAVESDIDTAVHPRADAFQEGLERAIDAGLPGVVMAVRDAHGAWEGAAGFADLGRRTPMERCHRTRIASVTKTFVAATVLQLVEAGTLDLDVPIVEYLPEERNRLPHADTITLRHLLGHTSGVYDFLDVAFVIELFNRPRRTWTLDECYALALEHDPEFAPGADWSYSNTNYLLAARVIEAATGTAHERVMHERIFAPLGLRSTSYAPDAFDFAGIAHGYLDLMGDEVLVDSTRTFANTCVGPDGGMVSSARDLLAFWEQLFVHGAVVGPDSLAALQPSIATGEARFPLYGLGVEAWDEDGLVGIGHGGHEFGYRTFAYHFPVQDVTFVLWFNASALVDHPDNLSATIEAQRRALRDLVVRGE